MALAKSPEYDQLAMLAKTPRSDVIGKSLSAVAVRTRTGLVFIAIHNDLADRREMPRLVRIPAKTQDQTIERGIGKAYP